MTGATGTIGSKVVHKLVKANAMQIVTMDRLPKLMEVQNKAVLNVADVDFNSPEIIELKFCRAMELLAGDLDHIFLCHGMLSEKNLNNAQIPDFDYVMRNNVRSHLHMVSLAFPFLKVNDKGHSSITVLTSA